MRFIILSLLLVSVILSTGMTIKHQQTDVLNPCDVIKYNTDDTVILVDGNFKTKYCVYVYLKYKQNVDLIQRTCYNTYNERQDKIRKLERLIYKQRSCD